MKYRFPWCNAIALPRIKAWRFRKIPQIIWEHRKRNKPARSPRFDW
ncbi:MAG: hypothetical protein AB1813_19195 [Verrucomicrobiota bacterium]